MALPMLTPNTDLASVLASLGGQVQNPVAGLPPATAFPPGMPGPTALGPPPAVPPPSMPRPDGPTSDNAVVRTIRSLAPLIFAAIAAKQGGPLGSAAVLQGFSAAQQRKKAEAQAAAELEAKQAATAEAAELSRAKFAQTLRADATKFQQATAETLAQYTDPAARAHFIAITEPKGVEDYGLPEGWLSSLPKPNNSAALAKAAKGILAGITAEHPDADIDGFMLASVPAELKALGVQGDAQGQLPVSWLRSLTGLSVQDASGKAVPVSRKADQPSSDYQRFLIRFAKQRGKKVADLTAEDEIAARKQWGQADDRPTAASTSIASGDATAIADAIESGNQPPDLTGLYRMGAPVRAELGRRGYNLVRAQEDWMATKRHLTSLNSTQQLRLRQAVQFAADSLDVIDDLNRQWQAGGLKVLNKGRLAAAKQGLLGQAAQSLATRLDAQISDLISELGTVYKGGNSSTDDSLALAAKNLQSDWSQKTLSDAIALVRTNLKIRQNSMALTQAATLDGGNAYGPGASALAPESGPREGESRPVPGHPGVTATYRGGKWIVD